MPTKNPRLNVVLEQSVYEAIKTLAQKEHVSLSLMARDLIKEALILYEDLHWQQAALQREENFSYKNALTHKDVWK